MDVYCTAAMLKARVAPGAGSGLDDRLEAAVILGSRYVDRKLGNPVGTEFVVAPDWTLTQVACDPTWTEAALAAAAFYYKLPDAPMGYLGGLAEYAVRVKTDVIPTADAILFGQAPGNWLVA